jgi:hypothetical protein
VLSTQTFERIDDEIELSGGGGLALAWHASDPNFLLAADDYPRIVGSPRSPEIEQRLGIIGRSKKCVAIVPRSGPDRWFVLEETGEVLIGNARQPARLWTVQSHGSAACSLAMDASGKRLAVAHDDGRIEVLESERRAPSPEEGFERVELRLTERLLTAAPRPAGLSGGSMALSDSANDQEALRIREAVAVDSRGRVAVAALRRRGDKADLVYLAEDDRGGTLEEVVDQMASPGPPTMCLKFDGRDRPHIVYRVEAADTEDDYDGRLRMARRTAAGRWTLEELAGLGNHGYTPNVVFHPDGRAEVLHFDLDTYRLWRASQVGGIWENQTVGRQGDGFNPHAALDRGGNLWMAWRVNRFNGDRSPAILGRWIGGRLEREVIDPGAAAVNQFVLQSDGSVAVLADSLSAEVRTKLAQRDSSGRWHTEPLPLRAPINLCRMTEHGDIYALEAFTGRWTLKWRARGKWRQSYAGGLQSDHSAKLVLDHRSRPVIVVPPEPASPNVVRVFRADWDGLEPGGAATESVD